MLAGLLVPSAGEVTAAGARAYLGHENGLDSDHTLRTEMRFWTGRDVSAEPPFGLAPLLDLKVRTLSQGQKRRSALWRIAESGAGIWLLDEPGAGLDISAVAGLRDLIARHAQAGGIAVIATHRETEFAPTKTLELTGAAE